MKNIYKKHNSFSNFKTKKDSNIDYNQISKYLVDESNIEKNPEKKIIYKKLIKLLDANNENNADKKFVLNPNVVEEIKSLEKYQVPNYLYHRYRYEIFPQEKILDNFPPYLQIEPTSICNYRCVFCYQTDNVFNKKSNNFMGHMSYETFKEIIDQASGNIEFISLASRGEPLMCKDIDKMLLYTKDKFLNLKINTNASMLNEKKIHAILNSGVKTLSFSADAADEKSYAELRVNGNLNKILKNINLFNEIKSKEYSNSKIITRVSGVKVKESQKINEMQKFWGDLVDQVAFVNYVPWENVYDSKKIEINTPCSDLWRRMFIWWDGKANPCDVDYKSSLSVGEISTKSISQIWKSDEYQKLRDYHISKKRGEVNPCNKCNVV